MTFQTITPSDFWQTPILAVEGQIHGHRPTKRAISNGRSKVLQKILALFVSLQTYFATLTNATPPEGEDGR
jgi:hypothetical protein